MAVAISIASPVCQQLKRKIDFGSKFHQVFNNFDNLPNFNRDFHPEGVAGRPSKSSEVPLFFNYLSNETKTKSLRCLWQELWSICRTMVKFKFDLSLLWHWRRSQTGLDWKLRWACSHQFTWRLPWTSKQKGHRIGSIRSRVVQIWAKYRRGVASVVVLDFSRDPAWKG